MMVKPPSKESRENMESVKSLSDRHCENKQWGWEEWIVNNDLYCGKRLHFNVLHGCTSLHFHASKHETMYVESGDFEVFVIDTQTSVPTTHVLTRGDSIVIDRLVPHRIIARSVPSVMVEFSTHHENHDSFRVAP